MTMLDECRALTDEELSSGLRFLAENEKRDTARLIAHLVEFDRRQLCVSEGGRSLFEHCVRVLGYEEFDAYRRVKAARFARRYPNALDLLAQGRMSMSVLALLETLPKDADGEKWLKLTEGLSRRDAESLVAAKHPQPARADMLRRIAPGVQVVPVPPVFVEEATPSVAASGDVSSAPPAETITASVEWPPIAAPVAPTGRLWQDVVPVAAEKVRVGFDAAVSLLRLIERARQVLRHKYPQGRLEDIVREALETLLDNKDPQRRLALLSPKARRSTGAAQAFDSGRYIPSKVKAAVWERDGGRCVWRFDDGGVCGSRDALEYDHVIPYALGGRSRLGNLRLLCRAHNRLAAERAFPRPDGPTDSAT